MIEKIYLVALREWVENVRTKAFWIGILIVPVLIIVAVLAPALLSKAKGARSYVVVDRSGWLADAVERRAFAGDLALLLTLRRAPEDAPAPPAALRALAAAVRETGASAEAVAAHVAGVPADQALPAALAAEAEAAAPALRAWWDALDAPAARALDRGLARARFERVDGAGLSLEALNERLADDELFAYLVIEADPAREEARARYVSKNLTDSDLPDWYRRLATDAVQDRRTRERAVDPELASWIQAELELERSKLSDSGRAEEVKTEDFVRQWAPVALVYLLWISVFSVAQMLLSNTVEEKSNRLMEVLLSSLSPFELMLGKIFGIAATGLTMVGAWVLFLLAAAFGLPALLGGAAGITSLLLVLADPKYLASFLVYFLLGYLLYAAVLVAIGSVCNTIKEAQNLQSPVMVLLFVPLLVMIPVGEDPNGMLAQVLSYVPPMTPFVMMNRAAGDVALWEYALTTALLLISVWGTTIAAAKIFRIGVLMTGKPPSPRELLRWIRTPVGALPARRPKAAEGRGGTG